MEDKIRRRSKKGREEIKSKIKAVMFVPYARGSRLAKKLRENEATMEKITGYRFKIVERSGTKLEHVLHQSNPWAGEDCGREACLLCQTKKATVKNTNQSCSKNELSPTRPGVKAAGKEMPTRERKRRRKMRRRRCILT